MSYNIGHIEVIKCEKARMRARGVKRLAEGDRPASCFLDELAGQTPDADGYVHIDPERFWWSGESSGNSWETFIEKVAPKIMGTLEAIVTWARGDSHSGLRIRDGKVTEPEVVMTLMEE